MNKITLNFPQGGSGGGDSHRFPRDSFRFCPRCGQDSLSSEHERVVRCGVCGFQFFFNTASAGAAFIFHEGKLILCVRARDPGRDKLDVPGGFIEYDESIEQGLQREIREELNIETGHFTYLCSAPNDYLYSGVLYKVADVFFTCTASHIEGIRSADDVAGFIMMSPEEVKPEDFAFHSTRSAFQHLLTMYRSGEIHGV